MLISDITEIRTKLTELGIDNYDTKPNVTPPREYVVLYVGETGSLIERLSGAQVTDRQVWRLMCVSRSLDVLRPLVTKVRTHFNGARIGGHVVRETDCGPELPEGTGNDTRYSRTVVYAHHHSRSTTS